MPVTLTRVVGDWLTLVEIVDIVHYNLNSEHYFSTLDKKFAVAF